MPKRTQMLIGSIIVIAVSALAWAMHQPNQSWIRFSVFLVVILLSSGLKVILPQGEGSMSLNFPFILLAVVELSPMQAMLLAALSVAAQCRLRVKKLFTAVQIVFNIANSVSSTAAACVTYLSLIRLGMACAPALSLASVAYFLASTVPVATAIATSTNQRALPLWTAEFPWYLPFYFVGAILAILADGIGKRFGASTSLLLIPMVYTIYRAYTAQIVRARERQQHLEETEALHLRTIEALAMAIEAKDQETHEHLFRVRNYVTEVGKELALSKLEMSALHTAAFLHDIGKLAVPEHIINKPGKLTPQEFETMKIHPVVGADILDRVRFPYPVVPIVRSHHEWWNGQGYPDGLKGEEIPIGARILTVVDCFDALASDRPYRRGKSVADAMAIVRSLSGTQFDPAIVDVFERLCFTMEKQAQQEQARVFVPLNLEIDVRRGAAPGAGFEQENGSVIQNLPATATKEKHLSDSEAFSSQLYAVGAASHEAQKIFEISQSNGGLFNAHEILSLFASRLRHFVPFDSCALYLRDGPRVTLQCFVGLQEDHFSAEPMAMGDGISGWVAQSGKPILNGNATVEPSYHMGPSQQPTLRSALSIPLFDPDREVFGALTLYALAADCFSRDNLRVLQAMEPKLSLTLKNVLSDQKPKDDSDVDHLTNLPNVRRLFVDLEREIDRCRRASRSLAVIVCRLDSLKETYASKGQSEGNRLASEVAQQLHSGCRTYDTVARVGSDEFVLLLPDFTDQDVSVRLASIHQTLLKTDIASGAGEDVSAKFGACFFPKDGETAEELLALAVRRVSSYQASRLHRAEDAATTILVQTR